MTEIAPIPTIKFPCGGTYTIGAMREEWRLAATGPIAWGGRYPRITRAGREMRVAMSENRHDVAYLRPVEVQPLHAGGYWPHGRATALVLSKDGDGPGLILRAYDADGTPGPDHIQELDG